MEFDYVKETEVTASGVDGRHNTTTNGLLDVLNRFIATSQELNLYKKVLFSDRQPEEVFLPRPIDGDTLDQYIEKEHIDLLHGIIGVATETGELVEIIRDKIINPTMVIDIANVKEEIGDNLWYLARLVKYADTTFEDEMKRNIKKLRARHGNEGFNKDRDINRDHEAEREILES